MFKLFSLVFLLVAQIFSGHAGSPEVCDQSNKDSIKPSSNAPT